MEEKPGNWKQDLKSPWLAGVVAIVFISLLVNFYMIAVSYASPHSLVAKDYYERGKAYFHNSGFRESLGNAANYRLKFHAPEEITLDADADFTLTILGRDNRPVEARNVYLYGYRIDDDSLDFKMKMAPLQAGLYRAGVRFSLPGTWDLIVQADMAGDQLDVAKRIFVAK